MPLPELEPHEAAPDAPDAGAPRIESIETILVDLPTIRPHQLSMTTMRRQTLVLARLRCSDGVSGVGEGTIGGLSYGDESPEGIKLAIDTYLAPALRRGIETDAEGRYRFRSIMPAGPDLPPDVVNRERASAST